MNKYFHGFMPAADDSVAASTEQTPTNYSQNSSENNQSLKTISNNSTDSGNRNNNNNTGDENTSSNNPLYPTNNNSNSAQNNNSPSASAHRRNTLDESTIHNFNRGLAEGIQSNPHIGSQATRANLNEDQQVQVPYTGNGNLIIQAFTAGQAIPIENVKITVTSDEPQTQNVSETKYTDSSGRTESISLPAPSLFLSQQAQNTLRPYAVYKITSDIDGYTTNSTLQNAMVFDQIESIQNIELIPIRESQK